MTRIILHRGEEFATTAPLRFIEPRCYTFADVAAVVGGLAAAASLSETGYQLAGGNNPNVPDLSKSSAALSDTDAALLPLQRGLSAAAQSGQDYTFTLPDGIGPGKLGLDTTGQGWYDSNGTRIWNQPNYAEKVSAALAAGNNYIPINSGTSERIPQATMDAYQKWRDGGSQGTFDATAGLTWKGSNTTFNGGVPITQNPDGSYTVSFKGYSKSDVQAQQAKQNAADQLALAQKFDPQFIAAALKQQAEADPESVAARQEESKLIQEQIQRPVNSPVSDMLDQQVQDTLSAAKDGKLTDMDTQRLNDAVAQALAQRGGGSGATDFSQPLTTGFAGEQRQANAAQGAMGLLASGSDPEDIAYRREQQNLSNLSSEVSGKTPQSQFASMSGAESGPTPMATANPLPVMPGGQDEAAQLTAIQNSQTTNRFNNSQVNPWMAGLSSLINLGGVAGSLGWKPFAPAS